MKTNFFTTKNRQKGLSLIELMISMLVGLFLIAGVVTNFISTQDNDRLRNAVSEMDANAAFAMKALRQTIAHTGYGSKNNIRIDKPFFTESDEGLTTASTCGTTSTSILPINTGQTKDSGSTDFLTTIYLADNPCSNGALDCDAAASPNISDDTLVYTDCAGGGFERSAVDVSCSTDPITGLSDPTQAKIYNTFSVNADNNLVCSGSKIDDDALLVDNVYALQFLYGIRDEGTDSTAYRTANIVEANSLWGQVRSVQIGVLMGSSVEKLLDADAEDYTYQVLDQKVVIPSDDRRRLFRLYTSTINLENLNKEPLGEGT